MGAQESQRFSQGPTMVEAKSTDKPTEVGVGRPWFPFLLGNTVYKELFVAQKRELVLASVMSSLWCLIPLGNNALGDPSMCTEERPGAK